MLRSSKARYWRYTVNKADERAAIDDRMTYIGNNVGFAFLWLISQYVLDSVCKAHALITDDINLFMRDGSVRFPWEMGDQDTEQVDRILFVSRSSKNDKAERGSTCIEESELVDVIVECCKESGVQSGDLFLFRYYAGRRKLLNTPDDKHFVEGDWGIFRILLHCLCFQFSYFAHRRGHEYDRRWG